MMRLNTSIGLKGSLQDASAPALVRIPVQKNLKVVVKKRQVVGKGQVVAENPTKKAFGTGFVHATIDGIVEEILPNAIVIGSLPALKDGEETAAPVRPVPASLDDLAGEDLCRRLMELGIDTDKFRPSRTLVINGLNPEPEVPVSEQLLADVPKTLELGLQILERAIKPANVLLVVSPHRKITLYGCTTIQASDRYPRTIDPLVVLVATGSERPDNVDVISVSDLYRVGRVAETMLPLVEAIVSVECSVFRVATGMPVQELLNTAGVNMPDNCKVILDGPMRGTAIYDLTTGVPENCTAITVVPSGKFPEVGPAACINCGECVLACPARIQPGMLSRYVEFGMYEEARTRHVGACLECGMCTYACPANRPVLQYLMLAKQQLALQDEFLSTCRLQS